MRRLAAFLIAFAASTAAGQGKTPAIDDLLNLTSAGGARLSPDGKWVVYSVTSTDWTVAPDGRDATLTVPVTA